MDINEGRRRLRRVLSVTSGGMCLALTVLTLIAYGTPYRGIWWIVMALILVAAFVVPLALVRPVEWVLLGYIGSESSHSTRSGS